MILLEKVGNESATTENPKTEEEILVSPTQITGLTKVSHVILYDLEREVI